MIVYRVLSLYVAAGLWFALPVWLRGHHGINLLGTMFLIGLLVIHALSTWAPPVRRAFASLLNYGGALFGFNTLVYFIALPIVIVKEIVRPTPEEFFAEVPPE